MLVLCILCRKGKLAGVGDERVSPGSWSRQPFYGPGLEAPSPARPMDPNAGKIGSRRCGFGSGERRTNCRGSCLGCLVNWQPSFGKFTFRGKNWRRGSELNRRIEVLQTSALPLGYRALRREGWTLQEKNPRARPDSKSPQPTGAREAKAPRPLDSPPASRADPAAGHKTAQKVRPAGANSRAPLGALRAEIALRSFVLFAATMFDAPSVVATPPTDAPCRKI